MGLNRYAKRRDENEADIVDALRAIGCSVLHLDAVDLLVGFRRRSYVLEVKTPTGALKPSQERIQAEWQGQYAVVRSVEQALAVVTGDMTGVVVHPPQEAARGRKTKNPP
jgi:hypothetical protein